MVTIGQPCTFASDPASRTGGPQFAYKPFSGAGWFAGMVLCIAFPLSILVVSCFLVGPSREARCANARYHALRATLWKAREIFHSMPMGYVTQWSVCKCLCVLAVALPQFIFAECWSKTHHQHSSPCASYIAVEFQRQLRVGWR